MTKRLLHNPSESRARSATATLPAKRSAAANINAKPDILLADAESPVADLVIVANRLPVQRTDPESPWESSPGGLVSALRPILQTNQSTWVGWSGETSCDTGPFTHAAICNWPVALTAKEVKSYYEGFSNRTIWPLYHDAIRPPDYGPTSWQAYVKVNRKFAEAAAAATAPDGIAWIHDYHLQLVPQMLRELRPDIRIGFFLHIPFPPQELFAQLPWRQEVLEGLLGADLLGFQTRIGAQNFIEVAERFTSAADSGEGLHFDGRSISVDAYPISIDFEKFDCLARSDAVIAKAAEYRRRLGEHRKILLGLDRLDYTKGIDMRLQAYQQLLRDGAANTDDCILIQIAVPSREHVAEYKELRVDVERLVGEIEGEFADIGHTPIHYLHRSVSEVELSALYCVADVMLVTPLRDGMNLVAKEYVASRVDDTGALVLSEFTGAARELTKAILVNPHDINALVNGMNQALHMPASEQEQRMTTLRRVVKENDVYHWADRFHAALAAVHA